MATPDFALGEVLTRTQRDNLSPCQLVTRQKRCQLATARAWGFERDALQGVFRKEG
jgi:hypothetical protein